MSKPLIIKNAKILDPAAGTITDGAILCENGKIADIATGKAPGKPTDAETIDARGQIVAPGLIDTRVFTGEPGHEYRETLASASKAAASGGVTSFLCMPDTSPVIDDGALVEFITRNATAKADVKVLVAAAITKGLQGKELTEFGLLKETGAVCFTDGRKSLGDTALLRSAFTYGANFDMPIINHLEDANLAGQGVVHEGLMATGLGLKSIPIEAETIPLERDLQLAALTGVRYHAAQLSSAASVEIMARHRRSNPNVTAGVSVNNLSLNETDVGSYRTFFKLSPPLRSEEDRQALVAALASGTIDVIHSGHDPQDVEVKRQPFAEAGDGAIGLETMLAAALRLVHAGQIDLQSLFRAMTTNPAKILGLDSGRMEKSAPADLTIVDVDYPWVVEESEIKSRSRNTTFEGARFSGKVMHTLVNGVEIYRHQEPQ